MATVGSSPSGFSYAQAAKGRTSTSASQPNSSKVTSGTATPATGAFSELAPGSSWADDVETGTGEKPREPPKAISDQAVPLPAKENIVERAKLEDRLTNGVSGISSPELAATSSTTTDDHSSSANNGSSSETTWETKSHNSNSEPVWIAERNARQITAQPSEEKPDDKDGKTQKKSKESPIAQPPPKQVVLQDAPLPMVNPWAKRAEDAKAKIVTRTPSPTKVAQASASVSNISTPKENQRPQSRKTNSAPGVSRNEELPSSVDGRKTSGPQGKRASDARITPLRQGQKLPVDETAKVAVPTRPTPPSAAPPLVRDQVSWPTPETAQEHERIESTDKDTADKAEEDATPTNKPRKKTAWATLPVTPSVVFETQNIKRGDGLRAPGGGERGGRGGPRGRGNLRGGANGGNGGDRAARRSEDESSFQRGRPGTTAYESTLLAVKPNRGSSASSLSEKSKEARGDRGPRGQSLADARPTYKAAKYANGEVSEKLSAKGRSSEATKQIGSGSTEAKPQEHTTEPNARSNSISTQTELNDEPTELSERGGPPVRMVPSESRKEPRAYDGPPRGGKRGGRGRGTTREFLSGHQANHMYPNGQSTDFTMPGAGVPPSPSGYSSRGNHQLPYSQHSRGSWNARGNSRSHSIPLETVYGGRFGPYGPNAHLPPVQTYVPGMYEYPPGYPMTAMPFTPSMDPFQLVHLVKTQLDYYFSLDNLLKDIFLRKNMDSQGFVLLDTIARFNRVKQLTQEKDILRVACLQSADIEVRIGDDNQERLRRLHGWEQFVMPINQRTAEAQNEGPQQLRVPETPSLSFPPPLFHTPMSAGPFPNGVRPDRRSYDAAYPMVSGFPQQFNMPQGSMYQEMPDTDVARGRATKAATHENGITPVQQIISSTDVKDLEPDVFPDEAASALTVVVKLKQDPSLRQPYHSAASRTFSNGSIDSRSIFGEVDKKPADNQVAPTINGDVPRISADADAGASISHEVSPAKTSTTERNAAQSEIFWMKDQPKPVPAPPDVTMEPYVALRFKALDQRSHAATGTCPYDLEVLYQFWCHFLIRNFNGRMYSELKYYADEDAKVRHNVTGLQNLIKFYSQALLSHNPIRDRVLKDCVELVENEPQILEGLAFKTLRSAWRNGALNLKNRKKLAEMTKGPLRERLDYLPEN